MAEKQEQKFPTELIDLPSQGKLYPKDSPLHKGKIELKYMTAKEEDILTSQNLIKKGVVLEKFMESIIITKGVTIDDLLLGDKNSVMIAARILAYGPEYPVKVNHPKTGDEIEHTFNLAECPFKELPNDVDYSENKFDIELPVSKVKVTIKCIDGHDEKKIDSFLMSHKKTYGSNSASPEITSRLKVCIIAVNGNSEFSTINNFVDNCLSKDSLFIRNELVRIQPDIILNQEVEWEGEVVDIDIPMTAEFLWPKS